MNKQNIFKRNELYEIIRQVGELVGEPLEDLRIYAKNIASAWEHDLQSAIICFTDILIQQKEIRGDFSSSKKDQSFTDDR